MRVSKEKKEETKKHILQAAGRGFRKKGYSGLGVDGLAQEAGMTSGAFYGHFPSKDKAFEESVRQGLIDYADTIKALKDEHKNNWPEAFIDFYLGTKHICSLENSCVVPGLSTDVMRAEQSVKDIYKKEITHVADILSEDLPKNKKNNAWAAMALLSGAVMMARCISDNKQASHLIMSTKQQALDLLKGK